MVAVDTNVLVRLLTGDDVRQAAVAEVFVARGAWVSALTLAEAIWVLSTVYERDASSLAAAVEMLLDHESLVLEHADDVAAALGLFRAKPKLFFSDCLTLQLASKAGHLPLGTFDRHLAKVDGAHLL